jgi:hypothetical protein
MDPGAAPMGNFMGHYVNADPYTLYQMPLQTSMGGMGTGMGMSAPATYPHYAGYPPQGYQTNPYYTMVPTGFAPPPDYSQYSAMIAQQAAYNPASVTGFARRRRADSGLPSTSPSTSPAPFPTTPGVAMTPDGATPPTPQYIWYTIPTAQAHIMAHTHQLPVSYVGSMHAGAASMHMVAPPPLPADFTPTASNPVQPQPESAQSSIAGASTQELSAPRSDEPTMADAATDSADAEEVAAQ